MRGDQEALLARLAAVERDYPLAVGVDHLHVGQMLLGVDQNLHPGGAAVTRSNDQMRSMGLPEIIIDGEVIEADPPHKLVQTHRFLFNDQTKAEGFTRLTWEVAATHGGFTRLTVTHDVSGAPIAAGMVTSKFNDQGGGGWNWILSDLKSLLETGANL